MTKTIGMSVVMFFVFSLQLFAASSKGSAASNNKINQPANSDTEQNKEDDATCRSYGAALGTKLYVDCRINLSASRQGKSSISSEDSRHDLSTEDGDGTPDDQTCKNYGFRPGTDNYGNCRMQLDTTHKENERRQRENEAERARYAEEKARNDRQLAEERSRKKDQCYARRLARTLEPGASPMRFLSDKAICDGGGSLPDPPPPPKPPQFVHCTTRGISTTCLGP